MLTSPSSFYRPSAYALAQVVVDVPQVFVQVAIFLIIVYLYAFASVLNRYGTNMSTACQTFLEQQDNSLLLFCSSG